MAQAQASGTIVQCIGAVIDIQFPREALPNVYDALLLEDSGEKSFAEKGLTFEVEQQLGDGIVRCITMGSADRSTRAARSRPRSAARSTRPRPSSTSSRLRWSCSRQASR